MSALPAAARVYVLAIMALGGMSFGWTLTTLSVTRPAQFLALLLLACIGSVFKFSVPLPRAMALTPLTMSLSFAVNFAALLLLGGENATLDRRWRRRGCQCTFNVKTRNPWFRTLFNMAALGLTMRATELVFVGLGGTYGAWSLPNEVAAIVGAAAVYYLLNSGFVAGAVALTSGQPFTRILINNFIQGWISHLFGAGLAALAAVAFGHTVYWVAPLGVVTLFLVYRTYRTYMDRIDEQQRAVQKLSDLHLATVEALALAIDAKDQASRAAPAAAAAPRRAARARVGTERRRSAGGRDRRDAARHRHARGAAAHPVEVRARSPKTSGGSSGSIPRSAPTSSALCRFRRRSRRSSRATTSAGMAAVIRPGSRASRFRSAPGSSRSSTCSTRCCRAIRR